jgi:spermidine/putrescine transport system ATP-binding protein
VTTLTQQPPLSSEESDDRTVTDARSTGIYLDNVSRNFGSGRAAVHNVTLSIADGEFFSIIGPSGCGKTTTLRMLSGLESPTGGAIWLGGKDVTTVPAYKRDVHTVFQNYALFPHLDVYHNVAYGLQGTGLEKAELHRRVTEMLELVELDQKAAAKPSSLSGGMQQRVALARALVLKPRALLLDEPLGALDLRLRRQMQRVLKSIHREVGITFVYVTHDQEEAFAMSDRVGIMSAGELVQVASPLESYTRPNSTTTARFVGASNLIEGTVQSVVSDGEYRVVLPGLGDITAAGVTGLGVGGSTFALLRPEALSISTGAEGGHTAGFIEGTVADVAFLGNHTSLLVDTASCGQLKVHVSGPVLPAGITEGAAVSVGWRPTDVWLVAP